ncbi:hypothetical protein IWW54_004919 [Coemansia sp. RSA 2705]|nr:hypothetical protein IWW54_004919 [Coemansia sp. RSA 2705]
MPGCLGVDDPILYLDGVYYHMGSIVDEQMKQAVDGGQTFGIVTSMDILVAVHNHPEMKAQVLVHKGSTTFDEFKMLCERELCSGIPIVGLMVGGCEITEMGQKMFVSLKASDTIEVVVKDLNNAT